jgi:hypothetical protein
MLHQNTPLAKQYFAVKTGSGTQRTRRFTKGTEKGMSLAQAGRENVSHRLLLSQAGVVFPKGRSASHDWRGLEYGRTDNWFDSYDKKK